MKRKTVVLAAALAALVLCSCGYTVSRTARTGSPFGANTVAVQLFVNDTPEPLVEKEVTAAIQEDILIDGRWLMTDGDKADVMVSGKVVKVDLQPLSYDAQERALEYRIRLASEIKLTDLKKNTVLWKEPIETFADYRVTEDVTKSKIHRAEAIRKASKDMAEEFIIKVLDRF